MDDPYLFGQIAAANALSDVYAMGGEPKIALNIVCFPNCLDPEILGEILRGGADKVMEAGAVLVGGHSVQDDEPKYGLSVTGFVHPDRIYKKLRMSARGCADPHEADRKRSDQHCGEGGDGFRQCRCGSGAGHVFSEPEGKEGI